MNFYLLSIIAFGVFVAILYLKSSEHQRMLYSQKYVRDKVSTVATPIQQLKAFKKFWSSRAKVNVWSFLCQSQN